MMELKHLNGQIHGQLAQLSYCTDSSLCVRLAMCEHGGAEELVLQASGRSQSPGACNTTVNPICTHPQSRRHPEKQLGEL
jgi:hypothetical protein